MSEELTRPRRRKVEGTGAPVDAANRWECPGCGMAREDKQDDPCENPQCDLHRKPMKGGLRMARDFEDILTSVYSIKDPKGLYDRLEKALTVGQKRGDRATILEALDDAEGNARDAHKLYLSAHLEEEKYNLQCEVVLSPMINAANAALQVEKDNKARNKAITDQDVRHKAAEMYPDEWVAQHEKKARVKGMVSQVKHLNDLWISRCMSLQTMLKSLR